MGALRHRIEILEETSSTNADGFAAVKSWSPIKSIWANMIPISNTEVEENGVKKRLVNYEVDTWYYPFVTMEHRIRYNGEEYDITQIINVDGRNKKMRMNCTQRTGKWH